MRLVQPIPVLFQMRDLLLLSRYASQEKTHND